jgi:hypothetical protein
LNLAPGAANLERLPVMIQAAELDTPRIPAFRKFSREVAPGRLKPELTGCDTPCTEFVRAVDIDGTIFVN